MIPFTCPVVAVHDGDTLTCASGVKIRIAGIDANEMDGSCHHACAPMPARDAQRYVERLTLHHTLQCAPLGQSYRRIVARCSVNGLDLSCTSIAAGAAVRWDTYWRRYRMGACG